MVAVPMDKTALLTFIREQFSAEEIWPSALIFDDHWEVESYIEDAGWHHEDDCAWEDAASGNGWINPDFLADAVENVGLTLGADQRTVEYEHDTQKHAGAIAYCTIGLCKGGQDR